MNNQTAATILIVDDNHGHAKLIMKNLKRSGLKNNIVHLDNGRRALDYLFGEGEFDGEEHISDIVLILDLNMPVMDGYQVLEFMRSDKRTMHIPVVVLSTTDDRNEISRCYNLGCNLFMTKPVDYNGFKEAIRRLGEIFSIGEIPPVKGDTNERE